MNKNRNITRVMYAEMMDMGGFPVRQAFPTQQVDQIDPFLLLHHADIQVSADVDTRHAGVGPHPHRGFSPVTFIFKGGVHHRDSRGNSSIVYEGGAQWMNAGMGMMHSERPPVNIHELGSRQELIQLWVNTPAQHKMDQPLYIPVTADDAPAIVSEDGLASLHLFAGSLLGQQGPVPTLSDVNAATLYFQKGGKMNIPLPASHNAFIYLLDGSLRVEGYGLVEGLHAAVFDQSGDGITLEALEDTRVLLMSGAPLHEKVVSYGPFVMNSETEIMEAMRDYRMGKMGVLIED